jgi:hypothetical protein
MHVYFKTIYVYLFRVESIGFFEKVVNYYQ